LNHRELHYINLPFYFSDRNSDSTDFIDTYLNLSTDFDLEHLSNLYRKRTKSYTVNIAYKTKDKKVQPVNKINEKDEKLKGRRDWYNRSKARDII
jgi:hypothetical protein